MAAFDQVKPGLDAGQRLSDPSRPHALGHRDRRGRRQVRVKAHQQRRVARVHQVEPHRLDQLQQRPDALGRSGFALRHRASRHQEGLYDLGVHRADGPRPGFARGQRASLVPTRGLARHGADRSVRILQDGLRGLA